MSRRATKGLYVPLEESAATSPKITKLARRLRVSRPTALGHLATLWASLLREAPNGFLTDAESIEILAQWDGDDGEFVEQCVKCRLIDVVEDGYEVHKYYGRTEVLHQARKKERARELTRERVRRHRERKALNADSCNAENVTETHVTPKEKEVVVGVGFKATPVKQKNLPRNLVAMIRAAPDDWPSPTEDEVDALANLGDVHPGYWAYVVAYAAERAKLAPWAYAARAAANAGHRQRWELSQTWPQATGEATGPRRQDKRAERFRALGARYSLGAPGRHLDDLISLDEAEPLDDALAEYASRPGAAWGGFVADERRRRAEADARALAEAAARGFCVPTIAVGGNA